MSVSAADQFIIFLYSLVCGLIIGFTFDMFRIIRSFIKSGYIATTIQDTFFWIIASISVIVCALNYNFGIIRFFMLFGILLGCVVYFFTLSKIIVKSFVYLIGIFIKLTALILKILLFPLKLIIKIFRKPIFFVFNLSNIGIKKIKNNTFLFKKHLIQLKNRKKLI